MAFLDNSGDIILDAVLTDTGRLRLAKGDGSFSIAKFAFGDDEINYSIYNKNHASGSAYYDVEILQTPVLEAFTNNFSSLKSKLLSISRTNLLYLPVIRRNQDAGVKDNTTTKVPTILVDQNTVDDATITGTGDYINGYSLVHSTLGPLVFDQGIESNAIGNGGDIDLDADLVETQYIVEIDNRLGFLASEANAGGVQATPSFIDDDNIASYYLSTTTNSTFFGQAGRNMSGDVIEGPRGTRLRLLVGPSTDLVSSAFLFTQLGGTSALRNDGSDVENVYHIDTTIRITGATTGYRVDIPIRLVKKQ